MSAITDALRLLDDEVSAFAFLPAINYIYLFWRVNNPSRELTVLSLLAIYFSAVGYNVLVNINFEPYSTERENPSKNGSILTKKTLATIFVSGLLWLYLFVQSLLRLEQFFGGDTIWPELLVAVSLLLISLTTSDLLFDTMLPAYDEE